MAKSSRMWRSWVGTLFLLQSVVPGFAAPVMDGPAELPRAYIDTTFPDTTGYVVRTVCTSGCNYNNLQTALNRIQTDGGATSGEVIRLASGQTFAGGFVLPKYTVAAGKWIIIRTDTADVNLPAAGVRISPSFSPILAKVHNAVGNVPVFDTAAGAHHYWLMGLEIAVPPTVPLTDSIIRAGSGTEANISLLPDHIYVDRCYVHGYPVGDVKRGFKINGLYLAAVNSYFEDIHTNGQDSQAIGGWGGPGPFKMVNNYLEAASENILLGGAAPAIANMIPSDVEIRFNHVMKPVAWRTGIGTTWAVKNLLEFKCGQRVLIEGNVFENAWVAGQDGVAILLKPVSSGSAIWATVADITVRYNVIQHTGAVFRVPYDDVTLVDPPPKRITLRQNLANDVGSNWGGNPGSGGGIFFMTLNGPNPGVPGPTTPVSDIVVDHNTSFNDGDIIGVSPAANQQRITNFKFTNNMLPHNLYGVIGQGAGIGTAALNAYFSSPVFQGNVIQGVQSNPYPGGNFFPATWAAAQFVNFAGGDFHLAASSPYKNAGTDGKDIGADIDAVTAATCYAISGTPGVCSAIPGLPPPSQPAPPPSNTAVSSTITPKVSPNPWRADRHSGVAVTFTQLPSDATIKIFTVSGHLVKEFSGNITASWDLTTSGGQKAASGIYLYVVTDSAGHRARGKLAILR